MENWNPKPARVFPPGHVIKRELAARGWTQQDLAHIMGRPQQFISQLVRGRKRITERTAMELAEAFGVSSELWLNLEQRYRLYQARRQRRNGGDIERRRRLYELVPVNELLKRGWIKAGESLESLEASVRDFLEIESLQDTPALALAMRHTDTREPHSAALVAWAKRVQHLSRRRHVADFAPERLLAAVPEILACSRRVEDFQQLPPLFNQLGVRVVIVPHLPRTYLDGAAFLLESHPVIALTFRYRRIDSVWFTLMHELAHIVLGRGQVYLDDLKEPSDNPEEQKANRWASDHLIPPERYAEFLRDHPDRHFSHKAIESFAEAIGRHPGIVVGRLHYEQEVPYTHFKAFLHSVEPWPEPWIDPTHPLIRR